ncbi:IclR family transcriptional regulator C-terminal domain-containing protein [Nocardioides sp. Bht2]|uniref:IclR family transcriptional regulator domain-containing protein n=1 Tax=Nocardioides sp. Bht2 TaxID=3392297 RepID=UPI0039B5FD83
MLELGRRTIGYQTLRAAAADALLELHQASGAVAHLSVLEGAMTCHLDKVGSGRTWHEVPSRIGIQLPATETAGGLSILAYLSPEEVDEVLDLQVQAGVSPVDRRHLENELAAIRRRNGVALRSGANRASRISSAAAPIHGFSGPVGTVSIAWRHQGPTQEVAVDQVARAARRVAQELRLA